MRASPVLPFQGSPLGMLAPAIDALEAQEEPFAIMRAAQRELLDQLLPALRLTAQATCASSNGFTAYNTADGQTSVALQVPACLPKPGFEDNLQLAMFLRLSVPACMQRRLAQASAFNGLSRAPQLW